VHRRMGSVLVLPYEGKGNKNGADHAGSMGYLLKRSTKDR
jgi:hypothetical protein